MDGKCEDCLRMVDDEGTMKCMIGLGNASHRWELSKENLVLCPPDHMCRIWMGPRNE
jgi:hypothetical protein